MKRVLLSLCILTVIVAEIMRVYLVMPYPGSQKLDSVSIAYWLSNNLYWLRLVLIFAIVYLLGKIFINTGTLEKAIWSFLVVCYVVAFFLFNFRYQADHIFQQPTTKSFTNGSNVFDKSKLVIGVVINGEPKAYPIQLIGYHHQVLDTVGDTPVMITYCTVCRTGRAFSPVVNGKQELFRLIGMDHFNAVFEDEGTKSWWRQATGEAIVGPMKGKSLKEFPSSQLALDAWLRQYPQSMVMQPDTLYNERYFRLEDYDAGTMQSKLVRRDTFSWRPKSWIVGVMNDQTPKAYDWNELVKKRIIEDSINAQPIILAIENDINSFHVYDRRVQGVALNFHINNEQKLLIDENTQSIWNMDGLCIEGTLKGQKLERVQAYNEFWHSWQTFRKNGVVYR